MRNSLSCFKAYDIRGIIGKEFNEEICYLVGRAFATLLNATTVVVGYDARETSPSLCDGLIEGLKTQGVEVINIGLCGTEEVYWATSNFNACGGLQVTASHNPINFNGLKLVKSGSAPLNLSNEFNLLKKIIDEGSFASAKHTGKEISMASEARDHYVKRVLTFLDNLSFKEMKVVVNSGNGAAGPTFDAIEKKLHEKTSNLVFKKILHNPDSSFPNGVPNPLLKENQILTQQEVIESKADLGIAFDGDFDRCFLFDETGRFISGEFVIGIMASCFLKKNPLETIVHDCRSIFHIQDIVAKKNGTSLVSKTGHVFVKQLMRESNAIYGGEISGHHYFRDFAFCDSGMIPWLVTLEYLSDIKCSLYELLEERRRLFPSSGEINYKVTDKNKVLSKVISEYKGKGAKIDLMDGISCSFEDWRFNLRASATENLLRLNAESRIENFELDKKVLELEDLMKSM